MDICDAEIEEKESLSETGADLGSVQAFMHSALADSHSHSPSNIKLEPIENNILPNNAEELTISAAEPEDCDLESKIEIEEDLIIKTESSDLSEFLIE